MDRAASADGNWECREELVSYMAEKLPSVSTQRETEIETAEGTGASTEHAAWIEQFFSAAFRCLDRVMEKSGTRNADTTFATKTCAASSDCYLQSLAAWLLTRGVSAIR